MRTVLTNLVCILTLSATLVNAGLFYQPEQVHISLGENVSAIVVTWSTKNFTESFVQYGIGDDKLTLSAKGSSTKFVDQGARKLFQYIHRVTLTNLQPKTQYTYRCGSDLGWSDTFQFTTVPDDTAWSPRLAVYGDLGNDNAQSLPYLERDVARGMYDAIIHDGDFAYNLDDEDGEVGDQFMRKIESIAAKVPYMVAVGNHEEKYNFSHYKARFSMPGSTENMFYSFDLGPAHFIGFSSEVYYPDNINSNDAFDPLQVCLNQYRWLEDDLKEATKKENRSRRPWIITFAHKPMYCSDRDRDDCSKTKPSRIRSRGYPGGGCEGLESMFYKYGVDVEIWAHEHTYERLWPVYEGTVYNGSMEHPYTNPTAPVHIITGSAGCKEDIDEFKLNPQDWSAFRSRDYGFTRMQLHNATHLHLEQVSVNKTGAIIDDVWLIKENHGPYKLDRDL